jgi:peptidoglycan-N-acetylglucosamine deacetylase
MILIMALPLLALGQPSRRQIAITFDDLPVAQSGTAACNEPDLSAMTRKLLQQFDAPTTPLTAFVIGGNCSRLTTDQKKAVLRLWMEGGAEIGNHTFSHFGLRSNNSEEYEQDILRADSELRSLLGLDRLRYFRSPMLWTGPTPAAKERLELFLKSHRYEQSPVTIDNSDWIFANVYSRALRRGDSAITERAIEEYIPYMESVLEFFERRSVEVLGREFPQILLLHANTLNADAGARLLTMLRKRGYEFVSLETALRDPAYRLPNTYAGPVGFSWVHRWSITKGMPKKSEPEPAEWIMKEFERYQ